MEYTSDYTNNDSLEVASKTWNRVIDSASKVGYSEGIKDGSMSVFQHGFDKGYKEAFKTTFLIGVYKGLSNYLTKDLKHPTEIQNVLLNTKKGTCCLCNGENKESLALSERTIQEIEICQREHSKKILKSLQDYFNPLLKEYNVNLDLLDFYT